MYKIKIINWVDISSKKEYNITNIEIKNNNLNNKKLKKIKLKN